MNAAAQVDETIGLAECAAKLRIPYQDAHRLLLTGQLSGEKRGGRWFCTRESLEQIVNRRGHQAIEAMIEPIKPTATAMIEPINDDGSSDEARRN